MPIDDTRVGQSLQVPTVKPPALALPLNRLLRRRINVESLVVFSAVLKIEDRVSETRRKTQTTTRHPLLVLYMRPCPRLPSLQVTELWMLLMKSSSSKAFISPPSFRFRSFSRDVLFRILSARVVNFPGLTRITQTRGPSSTSTALSCAAVQQQSPDPAESPPPGHSQYTKGLQSTGRYAT